MNRQRMLWLANEILTYFWNEDMANPIGQSAHLLGQHDMNYITEDQNGNNNNALGILSLGNNYVEEMITRRRIRARREKKSYFVVTDVQSK